MVDLKGVFKAYNKKMVIEDVNLSIQKGKITSITIFLLYALKTPLRSTMIYSPLIIVNKIYATNKVDNHTNRCFEYKYLFYDELPTDNRYNTYQYRGCNDISMSIRFHKFMRHIHNNQSKECQRTD